MFNITVGMLVLFVLNYLTLSVAGSTFTSPYTDVTSATDRNESTIRNESTELNQAGNLSTEDFTDHSSVTSTDHSNVTSTDHSNVTSTDHSNVTSTAIMLVTDQKNFTNTSNATTTPEYEYDLGEYEDEYLLYLSIKQELFYWGMFVISCLGAVSNLLVFATMMKCRRLRNNSAGILMISLASVDAVLMITEIVRHVESYHIRILKPYCLIHTYIMNVTRAASHLVTLLISINRYALVCHPFHHKKVTSKKSTLTQLTGVLLFSLLGSIFVFYVWDPINPRCLLMNRNKKGMLIYYVGIIAMVMVMSGIAPILVTFFLSTRVIYALKRYKEDLSDAVTTKGAMSRKAGERQVTWALISVNIAFVVLNLPYMLAYIVYFLNTWVDYPLGVYINNLIARMALKMFDTMNYVLNFYLYCFFSQTFRQAFVNLVACRQAVDSASKYTGSTSGQTNRSKEDDDVEEMDMDNIKQ